MTKCYAALIIGKVCLWGIGGLLSSGSRLLEPTWQHGVGRCECETGFGRPVLFLQSPFWSHCCYSSLHSNKASSLHSWFIETVTWLVFLLPASLPSLTHQINLPKTWLLSLFCSKLAAPPQHALHKYTTVVYTSSLWGACKLFKICFHYYKQYCSWCTFSSLDVKPSIRCHQLAVSVSHRTLCKSSASSGWAYVRASVPSPCLQLPAKEQPNPTSSTASPLTHFVTVPTSGCRRHWLPWNFVYIAGFPQ